ncbi:MULTISPECIES: YebO family protein [Erwinia]|uniref:YebO family protein n=1 Tax=Erwinia TaxID=551 RepID=UPI00055029DA|nr:MULTISPECIES: YebO family protein [Erwinia]
MNELANGMFAPIITVVLFFAGVVIWFFINRASVRANQQIKLLEALLEEQKRQNAMLRKLTDSVVGKEKTETTSDGQDDNKDFIRLIPER